MYGCITKEILFSNKYKSSWTFLLFSLYTLTGFRFGWFNLRQKNIARDMDNMVHSNWWQVQNGVSYITYFYTNYWLGSFFACNYWQIVENNFCCNKTIYFRPQISVALLDIYTLPLGRIQVNSSQYISGNNQIIKTSIPLQISKHPYTSVFSSSTTLYSR